MMTNLAADANTPFEHTFDIVLDGKCKSMALARSMIRILANDDYLRLFEGTKIKCRKNLVWWWIDSFPISNLLVQKGPKVGEGFR